MKLRIAKKIYKAIGTPNEARYSQCQQRMAINRVERTKSAKENAAWFQQLITPAVAANYCLKIGRPAEALKWLVETPEEDWHKPVKRKDNPQ